MPGLFVSCARSELRAQASWQEALPGSKLLPATRNRKDATVTDDPDKRNCPQRRRS